MAQNGQAYLHRSEVANDPKVMTRASDEALDEYRKKHSSIKANEEKMGFEHQCRQNATEEEQRANEIIQWLRHQDQVNVFNTAPRRKGYGGQLHSRFVGDHFLSNKPLIEDTALFRITRQMPKGSHLHIHFNSCLQPHVLLDIAKEMDGMWISSDLRLTPDNDYESFEQCEIQFSLATKNDEPLGNLFHGERKGRRWMKFQDFLRQFPAHYEKSTADEWLSNKLMFHEDEAHNCLQSQDGIWEKFNGRTRMMKGLINYRKAYAAYMRRFLQDLVSDNILYAEIRVNFMQSNQLYDDDGSSSSGNRQIMELIIDEVRAFQNEMSSKGRFFGGVKVIYCTPRSFNQEAIAQALGECFSFKLEWPGWIAGFDLVGEESKGKPLQAFVPELLGFKRRCEEAGIDIPLLFHCGETIADEDDNLSHALNLGSKRIGHGFALINHPYIMQRMKDEGVCLELCPISNEILGLAGRISQHAMYPLLASNVHCTLSSDNGTLFRSSLSHDFYQVLVGKSDMSLSGCRQLILWSIEHACLEAEEYGYIRDEWERQWAAFLDWIIKAYWDQYMSSANMRLPS
ncbi:hypothetical protein NW754_001394 [Fusarium falciforme]|nr:hypothetical protein NW754_001394 [Fusarium falciforme]